MGGCTAGTGRGTAIQGCLLSVVLGALQPLLSALQPLMKASQPLMKASQPSYMGASQPLSRGR
eukprot:151675-Rhodomonas_salina.1